MNEWIPSSIPSTSHFSIHITHIPPKRVPTIEPTHDPAPIKHLKLAPHHSPRSWSPLPGLLTSSAAHGYPSNPIRISSTSSKSPTRFMDSNHIHACWFLSLWRDCSRRMDWFWEFLLDLLWCSYWPRIFRTFVHTEYMWYVPSIRIHAEI